jgi:hypothetical protein
MKKNRKRLVLNRETLVHLTETHFPHVQGGGLRSNPYGACLTDECSVAYCYTAGSPPFCEPGTMTCPK